MIHHYWQPSERFLNQGCWPSLNHETQAASVSGFRSYTEQTHQKQKHHKPHHLVCWNLTPSECTRDYPLLRHELRWPIRNTETSSLRLVINQQKQAQSVPIAMVSCHCFSLYQASFVTKYDRFWMVVESSTPSYSVYDPFVNLWMIFLLENHLLQMRS